MIQKTLILFLFKGVGAAASLILGMIISKYYGLEVLGEYGLLLSYILIFSIIATWGSNIYVIEYQQKKIDKKYFYFNFLFSLSVSLVSLFFFYKEFNLFYIGGIVFINSFLMLKSSYFMVNGFQYYNAFLDDFLKYIIPIIILILGSKYYNFFELFFISQSVLFILGLLFFYKLIKLNEYNKLDIFKWNDKLKYGVLPTISALLVLLNAQFDRIILSYTVSKEMLGIYYAAQTVMALVTYVTISVMMVITPSLISLYKEKNFSKLTKLSKKYSSLLFLISFLIFVSTIFFGKLFLGLYNINNIEGYKALLILLSGVTVSQLFGFGMTIYAYTEYKKKLIFYQLLVFLISSVLCLLFSSLYGILGAAFATASGLILIKFLIWLDFRNEGIKLGVI
ncbi:lipopolysaccharide biosynthesis protein [Acinetobacter indicus]|uniref:lipopolysaccharide biosynthesis protein n=1 Tax=Acinetobacter indicus TaxID=756892 RepID=UPI003988D726